MIRHLINSAIILLFIPLTSLAQSQFANFRPANDTIDINNIVTSVNSSGHLFNTWEYDTLRYDTVVTDSGWAMRQMYNVPAASNKNTIFTSALWMGGIDIGGQLHVAAQTYAQGGHDFWPGPLNGNGSINQTTSDKWDKVWSVSRTDIHAFCQDIADNGQLDNPIPPSILDWPAKGNSYAKDSAGNPLTINQKAAPFVDVDSNGVYNPYKGDYPDIKGDKMYWWVYNDALKPHSATGGAKIGVEIQASAYGFDCPQDSILNNTLFLQYDIINKSSHTFNDFYIGSWTDIDIDCGGDYIGSDTLTNAYYGYTGNTPCNGGYGANPPLQIISILNANNKQSQPFQKMGSFVYYNNNFSKKGNPESPKGFYSYLKAFWKDGTPLTYGGDAYGGTQPWPYMFPSSPDDTSSNAWSECLVGNNPSDRRGLAGSQPFTLQSGESIQFNLAYITTFPDQQNGCKVTYPTAKVQSVRNKFKNDFVNVPCATSAPCSDSIILSSKKDTFSFQGVDVYPNPANNYLQLKHNFSKPLNIRIFNTKGQLLRQENLTPNQKTLNIENLPNGLYLIQLKTDDSIATTRFIVGE